MVGLGKHLAKKLKLQKFLSANFSLFFFLFVVVFKFSDQRSCFLLRAWDDVCFLAYRFQRVAYLQQIWWLQVDGEFEFQFPPGTYSLFFRLQLGRSSKRLGRRFCNHEHVHGWDIKPVKFELTTSDGQHAVSQCYLDNPGNWVQYHAGDFVVKSTNALVNIKFSLTQIDCTHTKGGLCVDSVFILPTSVGK